ncbi:hypothetical protein Poli38472_005190 [Pythium oligandrum]|uniref:Uncharacterized protein n=1 Tax=Pythium oligandrum TaxID=41045 RepID=A0A8K1CFV9_PYTOL|nr:hypothetical protein Poli38472_005190 [Pythium oligandrum]|eukprot:TMW62572.1 hypothetical protein Poli38472_005190 [Pythium oligandrum]
MMERHSPLRSVANVHSTRQGISMISSESMAPSVRSSSVSSRDVVFVTSAALVGFGSVPLLEAALAAKSRALGARVPAEAELTQHDMMMLMTSAALAITGFCALTLQWGQVPVKTMRKHALVLSMMALVFTSSLAALVDSIMQFQPEALPKWATKTVVLDEPTLEWKVNDLFCHAHGTRICSKDIFSAMHVFPLPKWPDTNEPIENYCTGFQESVRHWNHPPQKEVCRLCNAIKREDDVEGTRVLGQIGVPTESDVAWCGVYLTQYRTDVADHPSPYRTHTAKIQAMLHPRLTPCSLFLAPATARILLMWAIVATGGLLRWSYLLLSVRGDVSSIIKA